MVRSKLLDDGWRVATVWECALRKPDQVELAGDRLARWLVSHSILLELGSAELIMDQKDK